jgi:polyferredoxin
MSYLEPITFYGIAFMSLGLWHNIAEMIKKIVRASDKEPDLFWHIAYLTIYSLLWFFFVFAIANSIKLG